MIYAIKHNNVNRSIYKNNEDALTSAIFERLMYLPRETMHYIITKTLFNTINNIDLRQLYHIEYWPKWSAEETENSQRVIPDVFIRTANQDIIVEAKRYDSNQQKPVQWENEIQAYYNEYKEESKELIFIALGGIHSKETDSIEVKGKSHNIYKADWTSLLSNIQDVIHDLEMTNYINNNVAVKNILDDIVLCFQLFGYSTALWPEKFIKESPIKNQSINYISQEWTIKEWTN